MVAPLKSLDVERQEVVVRDEHVDVTAAVRTAGAGAGILAEDGEIPDVEVQRLLRGCGAGTAASTAAAASSRRTVICLSMSSLQGPDPTGPCRRVVQG